MWVSEMEAQLAELRATYSSARTRGAAWRRRQLKGLLRMLQDEEEGAFEALRADLGKHRVEAYRDEIGIIVKSLLVALDGLDTWMAPQKVKLPLFTFPSKGEVVSEPLGVVLIFTSWNFPICLALEPLIGAIAAGNVAALKVSELAPASAAFLANNLPKYLDPQAVKVFEGGPELGQQLLEHKWDKIFFTGSPRVARLVMTAAAKNLTPVTLELGGKCPCIVDGPSIANDSKVAIKRLVTGKWGACGQACVGIDYIITQQKFASILIDLLKTAAQKRYVEPGQLSKIGNEQHFQRLTALLNDSLVRASIVYGGHIDYEKQYIEPTILLNPPLDSQIMTEEIFGPLLPVITFESLEDGIDFINARPKPLAVYAFTNDNSLKRRIVEETSSGGVTFNDTIIQFAVDTFPFGGVGESGFGKYHGKHSFNLFSHGKAVLKRNFMFDIPFRYPPWSDLKLRLIRAVYNFNYLELVLLILGLKRR